MLPTVSDYGGRMLHLVYGPPNRSTASMHSQRIELGEILAHTIALIVLRMMDYY